MKTSALRTVLAGVATLAVIVWGTSALAGKGMGHRNDGQGFGCGYARKADCPFGSQNPDIAPEQREQLEAQRRSFFEDTRQEREALQAKHRELMAEMAKEAPDANIAMTLQQDISDLRANLDQKRLNHLLAMRKIHPDAARGFCGDGHGMGYRGGKGRHCGFDCNREAGMGTDQQ